MRRTAIALTVMGTMLFGAAAAHASTLTEANGIIYYVAGQGERRRQRR